ncbi:MAG: MarR family transcriptional regulator [Cyclobacteriaceae bacterium]
MKDTRLEGVLYYLLEKANKMGRRYAQRVFDEEGLDITKDQWLVLKVIADNERTSQVALATTLFKDTAAINRILNLMEGKNLIKRLTNTTDKRQVELVLTGKGQNLYKRLLPKVVEIRRKGVEGMTAEEIDQLSNLLNKMIRNLT